LIEIRTGAFHHQVKGEGQLGCDSKQAPEWPMAGVLEKVDASDEPCVSMLTELGVESTTYAHPLATTVEEQGQHVTGIEVRIH
jgi:hypothetical protein